MKPLISSHHCDDWRVGLPILKRQKQMWTNKHGCDVRFVVGSKDVNEIAAHSFVLLCGSPVFEAMLTRWLPQDGTPIAVQDVEPRIFDEMLRYLYCEEADITVDNVFEILYAAKKYIIPLLSTKCVHYLENMIDDCNVYSILNLAIYFEESKLTRKCFDFVVQNSERFFGDEEFSVLTSKALETIIELKFLGGISEYDIYLACIKWADARCTSEQKLCTSFNRRDALGRVFNKIRFSAMTREEFSLVTQCHGLLTTTEQTYISKHISGDMSSLDAECPRLKTCVTPRACTVSRFNHVDPMKKWLYISGYADAITFQCDKDIDILGVGIYGGEDLSRHNLQVKLIDDMDNVIADTGVIIIQSDGTCKPTRILFPTRTSIRMKREYTIQAMINGPWSFYGMSGIKKVQKDMITFTFRNSTLSRNLSTVLIGQVPEIIYSV